jgi:hypothetical protein
MKKLVKGVVVLVAMGVGLLVPGSASAHDWDDREHDDSGLYIGLGGMGNFVVNQANAPVDGFINQGGGFTAFLGLRLGRMLALEAGYTVDIHNPVHNSQGATVNALVLHSGTLDLKILFPTHSPFRPFLQAGLGVYELASYADSTDYRNGLGFQLGGGLDFFLNRVISVGGRVLYHGISFTQEIDGTNPFLSTVSVEGNIQIHF